MRLQRYACGVPLKFLHMPSTAADILAAAGLTLAGRVRWSTPIPESASGVYVVALTHQVDSTTGARPAAPLLKESLEQLLTVRPELELDRRRPDLDTLAARLRAFWLADETVVYIGLATSL